MASRCSRERHGRHGTAMIDEAIKRKKWRKALQNTHITPVYYAASRGLLTCVRVLLDNDQQPGALCHGETALCAACRNGDGKIAILLLQRGADPNLSGCISGRHLIHERCSSLDCSRNRSPLEAAVAAGKTETVKVLANYADVNVSTEALYLAEATGQSNILQDLIQSDRARNHSWPVAVGV